MANSNRKSSRKMGGFDGKYIVPILVVASLVMLAAFAVSADGNAGLSETKEYNCGPAGSEEAVKATLDTDTGLLTVDAKVTSDMGNYGDGEAPWYGDRDYIKRVAVNNVNFIGSSAFYGCAKLTHVTIGSSVAAINNNAFNGCSKLTSIIIPSTATGGVAPGSFTGCTSLKTIVFGSNLSMIAGDAFGSHVFYNEGTKIEDMSQLKGNAFIANGEEEGKIKMVMAKKNIPCGPEKSDAVVAVVNEDDAMIIIGTGPMMSWGEEEQIYKDVTSAVIEEGVTSVGLNAFNMSANLVSVMIGNDVESIENSAFKGCESLKEITIPDSVTEIGTNAFENCKSLKEITIPDGVTLLNDYLFSRCTSLEEITIPDSVTSIGHYVFNRCENLKEITIPDSVTEIGNRAFNGCVSLEEITIPDGVTEIGTYAFCGCESLEEITIPDGVTSIGTNAFENCTSLEEITIPDGVTSIGTYAFSGCNSLKTIVVEEGVTGINNLAFDSHVFYNGETLITDLSSGLPGNKFVADGKEGDKIKMVKEGGGDIVIDEVICSIDGNNATIIGITDDFGKSEFTVPKTIKYGEETYTVIGIEANAFENCGALQKLTVQNNVQKIDENAFTGCTNLREIRIDPNSTIDIDQNAFKSHAFFTENKVGITDFSDLPGYTYRAEGANDGVINMIRVASPPTPPAPPTPTPTPICYEVSYDIAGGSEPGPGTMLYEKGASTYVAQYVGFKEGYTFGGWQCNGKTYQSGDEFVVNGNMKFTAVWNALPGPEPTPSGDNNTGLIVGIVVAVVAAIAVIGGAVYFMKKK